MELNFNLVLGKLKSTSSVFEKLHKTEGKGELRSIPRMRTKLHVEWLFSSLLSCISCKHIFYNIFLNLLWGTKRCWTKSVEVRIIHLPSSQIYLWSNYSLKTCQKSNFRIFFLVGLSHTWTTKTYLGKEFFKSFYGFEFYNHLSFK